jgi:hypothetical protein
MQLVVLLTLFLTSLWPTVSIKHPFHTSIGDCNYNPKTNKLEFSIRLFTDDLESAVNAQLKKPIILQQTKAAEPELQRYLLNNVKVWDAK